jgi:hypothetical protein
MRRLDLPGHLREFIADDAVFDQELAECLAAVRVVQGFLIADAGGAVDADADEDAFVVAGTSEPSESR